MLNILSRQQENPSLNMSYIVPFQWWENLLLFNSQLQDTNDIIIADSLNIDSHIDSIEPKERQAFIKLVGQKVNHLQIDNFILNPKLKTATKWKTVSKKLMELLKKKLAFSLTLPFIYVENIKQNQNQSISISQNNQFKLIKLLICSYTQNHVIYGYIERRANMKTVIQQIISFFDYFYTEDTKVTFLESNQFRNYKFQECNQELQFKSELIMIYGLQRYDQKLDEYFPKSDVQQFDIPTFESPRLTRISRNGEQLTMADEDSRTMSEHTMSTGAETPFTFGIDDQDWDLLRPFQNFALFGERLEQQIQHMKQYARQAIYTDIIEVPLYTQELMISELNKLAQDIEENIEKKKMYQKQIAKDAKQYYKDLKQTHHTIHVKDKQLFYKEPRQLLSKKIQSQQKGRQNIKSVIYYSLGNQNN